MKQLVLSEIYNDQFGLCFGFYWLLKDTRLLKIEFIFVCNSSFVSLKGIVTAKSIDVLPGTPCMRRKTDLLHPKQDDEHFCLF